MNASVLESIVAAESTDAGNASEQPSGADAGVPENAGDAGQGGPDGELRTDADNSPAAEPKPAADKPGVKQDVVPHAALHEARETVKQLKQKIGELEAQPRLTAEDAALLKELKEARAAQQAKEQEPDFLADPKGYVDQKVAAALKKLEQTEQKTSETDQKFTQQQVVQQVLHVTATHETEFSKTAPDYPKAIEYVRTLRANQLKAFYPEATPQQIAQAVSGEEIQVAHQLLTQGKNVAEFAYNYAKQLGYKASETPAPTSQGRPPAPDKSAVRTLGSGGGDGAPEDSGEDPNGEFLAAQGELIAAFKRK